MKHGRIVNLLTSAPNGIRLELFVSYIQAQHGEEEEWNVSSD